MSNTSPIGLATLGAGIFAKEAHIPALASLQSNPRTPFKFIATYSRSHKSSSSFASFAATELNLSSPPDVYSDDSGSDSDLDAMLKRTDIQAVIILLPIPVQPDFIMKCLEAGKHVLAEKPVAPSVKEGISLLSKTSKFTSSDKPLIFKIAENYECEQSTLKMHEIVTSGKIGKVTSFSIEALNDLQKDSKYYQTPWRTFPGYQGGFLLDGGVHSAALVRSMIPVSLEGKSGVKISGFTGLVRDYLAPDDTMNLSVSFGSGKSREESFIAPDAIGTFNLSFAAPSSEVGKKRNGFDIYGTEGWVSFKNYPPNSSPSFPGKPVARITIHQVQKSEDGERKDVVEEVEVEGNLGVIKEIESFFLSIIGQATEQEREFGDPQKALWDVAFIEAGLKSKGRVVDLGEIMSGV